METFTALSIPYLLQKYHGNVSAVARAAHTQRTTVHKYSDDIHCQRHAVVNGRIMTWTAGTSKGFCQSKENQ